MIRPTITCLLALSCLLAGPLPARAADPAQKSAEPEDQAAKLMAAGNKAFRDGKFAEAEKAYREAFALKRGYDIAGNLGAAEMAQGKNKEAAQHLAFTLHNFPITGDPALREQMQKAFDQAKKDLAVLRIQVSPNTATVSVDGARIDEAALLDGVFVGPGEHEVSAGCEACVGEQRHVSAQTGATVEVTFSLGLMHNALPRPEEPPPAPRRSIVPGLVIGGAAVLGLVGGGVFMGLSASRRSDAASLRTAILKGNGSCVSGADNFDMTRCPELQGKLKADDTLHNTAVGSFVVGGLAAAGTALYFLLPPRVHVTPVAGSRGGGALVSGSF